MQVHRPSLQIIPTLTPNLNIGGTDTADANAKDAPAGVGHAVVRTARATDVAPLPTATPQAEGEASVQLDLDHAQRARAAVTYGPDSIFIGKSAVEVATTPAERFVASAVEVMRVYEQDHAQASFSPLERLKQAVASRFSAQA